MILKNVCVDVSLDPAKSYFMYLFILIANTFPNAVKEARVDVLKDRERNKVGKIADLFFYNCPLVLNFIFCKKNINIFVFLEYWLVQPITQIDNTTYCSK